MIAALAGLTHQPPKQYPQLPEYYVKQTVLCEEAEQQSTKWCDNIARAANALQETGHMELVVTLFEQVLAALGPCRASLQCPEHCHTDSSFFVVLESQQ